jgi:hypothetical protein
MNELVMNFENDQIKNSSLRRILARADRRIAIKHQALGVCRAQPDN